MWKGGLHNILFYHDKKLYLSAQINSMLSYYFRSSISNFHQFSSEEIIGRITLANQFDSNTNQNKSWELQIPILKNALQNYEGEIFFEFSIPRMGKRIDALLIIQNIIFIIEFKVGESQFHQYHIDQVWDYALDLKNFHKPSHDKVLVPILVATEAHYSLIEIVQTSHDDQLVNPIKSNKDDLSVIIKHALNYFSSQEIVSADEFANGVYSPTPTIIEAAVKLYTEHSVDDITRNDATATNLDETTNAISEIIEFAKTNSRKAICFVTGVPGAGKTLVGLKTATTHLDKSKGNTSVYLSGNAPLVAILQEALTRDKVKQEKIKGNKITKASAKESIKAFIQIIHHYRDAYLIDKNAPYDHVAIFDEAQRAWNKEQTVKFMKQKKNQHDFDYSEPEFLISCLDRHKDWGVVICLVGGGQEINTGEAGISEWINAIKNRFNYWDVYISPNLTDSEYAANESIIELQKQSKIYFKDELHLSVSLRSFRAENLSKLIKHILDIKVNEAKQELNSIAENYPIVLTRNLNLAKTWLKEKARGNERYGMIVSSQAQRLKPYAIDVKSPMNPVNWFLDGKDDVRSSYYLEDVATEFHVQGLELDWTLVAWDGDLRFDSNAWKTYSFVGNKWQRINKEERKRYLINAYRVLLTRARKGMVIFIPQGNIEDHTALPEFYDDTFNYLKEIGLVEIN
jgi:DUF2075 family protein